MLITDSFVMLNYPKTGSSFARKMIKSVYKRRCSRLQRLAIKLNLQPALVHDYQTPNAYVGIYDQHGNINLIPDEHRHKVIVSIIRDPVARYVSQYNFRWWVAHPPADVDTIKKSFSRFPDLDFEDFYEMSHRFSLPKFLCGMPETESSDDKNIIGLQTAQFLRFFARDSESIMAAVHDGTLDTETLASVLQNITFLHQENLRDELKTFLINKAGFTVRHVDFISDSQRVNESIVKSSPDAIVPEHVKRRIHQREALLYQLFPEYLP